MRKCFVIAAFAFTMSHYDGCNREDQRLQVTIKGPFPTFDACDKVRKSYMHSDKNTMTKCWKIPETK